MKKDVLKEAVENLKRILELLPFYDNRVGERYAEYYVAYELAKRGFEVELANEIENTEADIYLPQEEKRTEVKSGDEAFSFGKGSQLKDKKFDYFVGVQFQYEKDQKFKKIKRTWIFTLEEMIRKKRKKLTMVERGDKIRQLYEGSKKARNEARYWADFPDTNPCLLYIYESLDDYEKKVPKWQTDIEVDLHQYPKKYVDKWDKIQ